MPCWVGQRSTTRSESFRWFQSSIVASPGPRSQSAGALQFGVETLGGHAKWEHDTHFFEGRSVGDWSISSCLVYWTFFSVKDKHSVQGFLKTETGRSCVFCSGWILCSPYLAWWTAWCWESQSSLAIVSISGFPTGRLGFIVPVMFHLLRLVLHIKRLGDWPLLLNSIRQYIQMIVSPGWVNLKVRMTP